MGLAVSEIGAQIEEYLAAVSPRYSPSSLRTYRIGLERFLAFCRERKLSAAGDLTDDCLQGFESWLCLSRPLSEATVSLWLRAAKSFMSWACLNGLTLYDGNSYSPPAGPSPSPRPPTVAVMRRLLELPKRATVLGLRDQFVLELLYSLGPRRSECSALNLEDLDLEQLTLRVLGKGGNERLLPVSPSLELCAQDYLCNSRPDLLADTAQQALFLNQRGQRLGDQSVNIIVRKYGKKLGLKLSAHQIRHACATHLVEAGMPLVQVQQILGHRSLHSTRRYAQVSLRQMEREFQRCRPRAQGSVS